jgi:competence protein ComEC
MLVRHPALNISVFLCFATAGFICILAYYLFLRQVFPLRWIGGLVANIVLFILGACLVSLSGSRSYLSEEIPGIATGRDMYLCRIEMSPVLKSTSYMGNAVVIAEKDSSGVWKVLKEKILAYFKDDSTCKFLSYGDIVVFSGILQSIQGPPNPDMFNFRKYLENRKIFRQVFIEKGHWQKAGKAFYNPIKLWAEKCRIVFLDILRKFGIEGREFALAAALLLGTRDFLEKEVIREFSFAGAIHVLSVSGLHVGIMYVVADKALFFLKNGKRSRKLHQVMILACIWAYAFISGLPSSVVRAALMFSLIAAGKMFRRNVESYNILAVSAFLQLLINPYEITDVGFQLSYVAVLGIFAFYKPINELVDPGNKFLSMIWSILAVSIAAQLATFPLACHYFYMFPTYFLLTNFIVVPLAAVVTYFAVSLLVIGGAGFTFEWLGWPLKWSLRFMGASVETIQSWPGAVIQPVVLTTIQVVMIYLIIAGIFIYWLNLNRRGAFIILTSLLVLSVLSVSYFYKRLNYNEITVYQVSGSTAIDFIYNHHAYFMCDSLLNSDQGKIEFQLMPHRKKLGVKEVTQISMTHQDPLAFPESWFSYPFAFFRGKTIVIIDDNWTKTKPLEAIACDLAVISGKLKVSPADLKKQVISGQFIIDNSVPAYQADQLAGLFSKEGIPCHSVKKEGAFVLNW